jgi:16S rRNA (cytosine1402-N4)-methyltransferase
LAEVIEFLRPRPGGVYVDCTVGAGGHAAEILRLSSPDGVVTGIDRDPAALRVAEERLREFGPRFRPVRSNFGRLREIVDAAVDGVLFDFGVSSIQLDDPERGFSYSADSFLDMRMDPDDPITAADLVNSLEVRELAKIIRRYGEEPWADRIARFIGEERKVKPIRTTTQLVNVIKAAVPAAARRRGGHPARRTFQALRIATNRELDVIGGALLDAVRITRPGGRVCAISFHSLEDRIVKRTFAAMAAGSESGLPAARLLTKKPVRPSAAEVRRNPRSRSARLRAVEVPDGF